MTRFILPFLFVIVAVVTADPACAIGQGMPTPGIPQILSYQGFLIDMSGQPVPDGDYLVTMRLYDTAEGGTVLWEERLKVSTFGGLFETYLGLNKPMALSFDRSYWLAAEMEGEPEMKPRTLLVAAPYAFRSLYSEKAAGLVPGAEGAVTGLNGARGEVTIVGADGVHVVRSGDTIVISGGGPGSLTRVVPTESKGPGTPLSTSGTFDTQGASGIIVVPLGEAGLATEPPSAGKFQDLGTIRVNNESVTDQSVIHVSVQEKEDDGIAPNPEEGIWMVDIDNRQAGNFTLRIGMIPTVTSSANFRTSDNIHIGYTIVNSSR